MSHKIEEAFNDCFERLSTGESLDSCLGSYPQYASELDLMLRTSYDIKRRAYPIQPRPEFKYWAKVRLQGVQDYVSRQPVQGKPSAFNWRRNMAISMAALLVFVIASSGTVAASSEAMPDEPLYGVKLAVEQAQVSFAFSDVDKAEAYANQAAKRAGEIVAMARLGKTEKVVTTTAKMNYQLDQAEQFISKYEEANNEIVEEPAAASLVPSSTPTSPVQTDVTPPDTDTSTTAVPGGQKGNFTLPPKSALPGTRAAANINRARNAMNASTAKSLAELQDALEKAPESAKPALLEVIRRTKIANVRAQEQLNININRQVLPPVLTPGVVPTVPLDKPKYIPPRNNNLNPADPRPFNKPNLQNALPQGGVNNQADIAGDSGDDNGSNQTNPADDDGEANESHLILPGPNFRLPAKVNPIVK
jgi:hypothetical protein